VTRRRRRIVAAVTGGGLRRRLTLYMSERMDGPQQHNGRQNLVGQLLLSKFWIEASFVPEKCHFSLQDGHDTIYAISEHNLTVTKSP